MIVDESKGRRFNKDEESEETLRMPLIMRSHSFRHQILAARYTHVTDDDGKRRAVEAISDWKDKPRHKALTKLEATG